MWAWVAMQGRCAQCWQFKLTVSNLTILQEGTRQLAVCPDCAAAMNRGGGDTDMAKQAKAPAEERGSEYAHRFPGGKPLHDEGGKLNWQWEKIGQELVGEFLGIKPYENGHIAKVREVETGTLRTFSAPSVLASYLDAVEPGTQIAIVFSGEKPAKKRGLNAVKLFEVYDLEEGK